MLEALLRGKRRSARARDVDGFILLCFFERQDAVVRSVRASPGIARWWLLPCVVDVGVGVVGVVDVVVVVSYQSINQSIK